MSINAWIVEQSLGVDKAYVYQGRIARVVRTIGEWNQVTVGGVLLSMDEQDYDKEAGEWERIDADVIIIPRAKFKSKRHGMRLDQVTMQLSLDGMWEEKE